MLDGSSIALVLQMLRPERTALLGLLVGLPAEDWDRVTECPAYSVKGVALHVLGDDLSLLSRQRDAAMDGLSLLSRELPGVERRNLLDTFNDRWVAAAMFLSTELVIALLGLTGEWTAAYYEAVDPERPGEPVGFFGATGATSPFWQAIAREYMERWIHHSQIRRALGMGSLAERRFLKPGVEVMASVGRMEAGIPESGDDEWAMGPMVLGAAPQATDILTRAHGAEVIRELVKGPSELVEFLAAVARRP